VESTAGQQQHGWLLTFNILLDVQFDAPQIDWLPLLSIGFDP
jgi:hypothetical protein